MSRFFGGLGRIFGRGGTKAESGLARTSSTAGKGAAGEAAAGAGGKMVVHQSKFDRALGGLGVVSSLALIPFMIPGLFGGGGGSAKDNAAGVFGEGEKGQQNQLMASIASILSSSSSSCACVVLLFLLFSGGGSGGSGSGGGGNS